MEGSTRRHVEPENDSRIAHRLAEATSRLDRVRPEDLASEMEAGALLVDTRPEANRKAEGCMPGALVIERTVLEWRLDPTSPDRVPEACDADLRVIVVCNEGYSSVLAAESLRALGLHRATDLVGGFRAWVAASRAEDTKGDFSPERRAAREVGRAL